MNTPYTVCEIDIPSVPADLILTMEQVQVLTPIVLYHEDRSIYEVEWYRVYTCNQELTDWVHENFPMEIDLVEYVISDQAIVIHTDLGRNRAYNYLLAPGGKDVITEFYTADRTQLINSIECETNRWYELNVGLPHKVSGPQNTPRFLISVTPKAGVTYSF